MHELAICQALLDRVLAVALKHAPVTASGDAVSGGTTTVREVTLRIGQLSGVEPHLLAAAYPLACAGSPAEGSLLVIETAPVRVRCRCCGTETEVPPNRLLCGTCGTWQTDLVSGDELLLLRVVLNHSQPDAPGPRQSEACDV